MASGGRYFFWIGKATTLPGEPRPSEIEHRVVHMKSPIRPSEALRMGLVKSVYFSQAIQEYDPVYEPGDDQTDERKPPVSRVMARAAWTGLVLQLVSLLDDGFDEFLEQRYPDHKCRKFTDKVGYLRARNHLKWPERVEALRVARNRLAHEVNFFSNFEDWNNTFFTVKRELEYLGVVEGLDTRQD
jgi:hypothetical protein